MNKSNLQRLDPSKQVLLIDFDQTIRNGGGTNGRIMKTLYKILEERGMDPEEIERISQQTINEKRYGTYNFILALCHNDINEFNQLCSELFPRVDYSKVHKDNKLFKLLRKVYTFSQIAIECMLTFAAKFYLMLVLMKYHS